MRYGITFFVALVIGAGAWAQEKGDAQKRLYEHLQNEAKERLDARRKEVDNLKTPDDIRKRQASLRAHFLEALGGFPEKTPLHAKVTGTLKGEGFRVEKVVYESRPNHHVTANLYLPDGAGPFPGVLVPCGHSTNGKAAEAYQRACMLMARNGLAVLCYDPIGQGERLQLLKDDGKPGIAGSTTEHTLIGVGAWLAGQSCATYRIWDGIRSLDYLASRPEVDAKRLGCTGNSGGGTLTAYLMALDDRIVAAAPSCYITSFEKLLATLGPQDAEQNITGQLAFGMDHADYLTMRAPRPTLMCVATYDFFSIDGAWSTFREASLLYSKLGHGERMSLFEFDDKHGFSKPRREAAMRWMRRWLLDRNDAPSEDAFPNLTDAQLQVTRSGQVLVDYKGISAFQISAQYADLASADRARFPGRSAEERQKEIRRLLGLDTNQPAPRVGAWKGDQVSWETEPGVHLPVRIHRGKSAKGKGQAMVLVLLENPLGDKADPLSIPYIQKGHDVMEVNLRGLGDPPAKKASFFGSESKTAQLSILLDRPLLGQRVLDVLAIVRGTSAGFGKIEVVGQGVTGPVALHAAALEPRIEAVTLDRSLVSWDNVVRTPLSMNQLANVVPGVLKSYDLPDLAATLAPRPLTLRGTLDAAQKALPATEIEAAYRACRQAYKRQSAEDSFRIE